MMWGSESSVKRLVKFHLARGAVRRLMTARPALLSGDGIVDSLTRQIPAEVESVRSQYASDILIQSSKEEIHAPVYLKFLALRCQGRNA